jgi:hypothetical protein
MDKSFDRIEQNCSVDANKEQTIPAKMTQAKSWLNFRQEKAEWFVNRRQIYHGLVHPSHQQLANWLTEKGFTVEECDKLEEAQEAFQTTTTRAKVKIEIRKQERGEDIVAFLARFEGAMELHNVNSDEEYLQQLHKVLLPEGQDILVGLPSGLKKVYAQARETLLTQLRVSKFTFIERFRAARKEKTESYMVFGNRIMRDLQLYFGFPEFPEIEGCGANNCNSGVISRMMLDLLVEQLLNITDPATQHQIREKIDQGIWTNFLDTLRGLDSFDVYRGQSKISEQSPGIKCFHCGKKGHLAVDCYSKQTANKFNHKKVSFQDGAPDNTERRGSENSRL